MTLNSCGLQLYGKKVYKLESFKRLWIKLLNYVKS